MGIQVNPKMGILEILVLKKGILEILNRNMHIFDYKLAIIYDTRK